MPQPPCCTRSRLCPLQSFVAPCCTFTGSAALGGGFFCISRLCFYFRFCFYFCFCFCCWGCCGSSWFFCWYFCCCYFWYFCRCYFYCCCCFCWRSCFSFCCRYCCLKFTVIGLEQEFELCLFSTFIRLFSTFNDRTRVVVFCEVNRVDDLVDMALLSPIALSPTSDCKLNGLE
jgi:hypothetical protein